MRLFKDFLQVLISVGLCLQYTFFQQRFFIRKDFIEGTLDIPNAAAISSIVILLMPFEVKASVAAVMIRSLNSTRWEASFPCSAIIRFSILLKCSFRFLFISKGKTEQRYIENSINKSSFHLFIMHLGIIIIQ